MTTALAVAGALMASAPASAGTTTDGTVVREWTDLAFAAVRSNNLSDARAARLYAMVDAAMYDAVNATAGGPPREAAIVPAPKHAAGDPSAAAAGAAHDLLAALFPAQAGGYDAQLASDLAAVPSRPQAQRGREYGAQVASAVLAARANDGSSPDEIQPGDPSIGKFQDPWSGVQFRNLSPFAIGDPSVYVGDGPPPLGSPEYMAALNTTRVLGGAPQPGTETPDDLAKRATYDYWALGGRTNQPPGAWLQVAEAVSGGLSLQDTARLFALESMAMADTVAPTYMTKFVHHTWRPTRAIRELVDPTWVSRSGSAGGTPEYFSGHSTFSSAGATVLAGFFCRDDLPFSLRSDSTGTVRSYDSFSDAATEAGLSRILGGLHFPFSNEDAAAAGRGVGSEVLRTALLREHGPTHSGSCPR
jgi:hypothetical protein